MKYLLLVHHSEQEFGKLSATEQQQMREESVRLANQIHSTEQYLDAAPLHPTSMSTSVRVRDGNRLVTDGPFAETREQLGGYFLVEASNLDDAIDIAGRIPGARLGGVEVRPVVELAGLPRGISVTRPNIGQSFIDQSRKHLTTDYLPRIERCLEKLSDHDVWWRANPESNSIGNLLLHLNGNVRQWIISGVGGTTYERHRQEEFDEQGPIPSSELLSRLKTTVEEADRVLAGITPAGLLEDRKIQGNDVTVLEAIYHVVEHFSMHTGQIILLTKMWKGDLAFYDVSDGTPRSQWHNKTADSQ